MNDQQINEIINETIRNMNQASTRGKLLSDAIVNEHTSRAKVLAITTANQTITYIWCYRLLHDINLGYYYAGMRVRRIERNMFAIPNEQQQEQDRCGVKWISMEKYRIKLADHGDRLKENPYNEIRISRHIRSNQTEEEIINNGIILPRTVVEDQGYFFIISETLANDKDLFDFIYPTNSEGEPLLYVPNMDSIRNLFRQMVRAVDNLHKHRVLHHDLSIENFVLHKNDGDHKIYVIDFGQAEIIAEHYGDVIPNENRGRYGKDGYTAPELLLSGKRIETLFWKKLDVWALGITLYYMLLGSPPNWIREEGNDRLVLTRKDSMFHAVCTNKGLARLLQFNQIITPIPEAAVEVLQGMLLANPNNRWSTEQILNHRWLA